MVPDLLDAGLGWAKSLSFHTGQCPTMKYHQQLMNAILHDKVDLSSAVNVEFISLDDAPRGYAEFDTGKGLTLLVRDAGHQLATMRALIFNLYTVDCAGSISMHSLIFACLNLVFGGAVFRQASPRSS